MQPTRRAILDYLKRNGQATLEQLAREVGLVQMTVRGHLSVLERDGMIATREERGKVGRPRFVYSLTEGANDQFPKSYQSLCSRVLDAVSTLPPNHCCADLTNRVAEIWAGDHAKRVEGQNFEERCLTMAKIRTEEGAMATVEDTDEGCIIHQCHCPARGVAGRHPNVVCAAELEYIKRLLEAPVERIQWMLEGSETCSYKVTRPLSEGGPTDPAPPGSSIVE
ncbi:MAG TPA: helix-turn-helix domain-containing protein [Chloroflexota bacterium]|nr:helix-turn-helix domain-containing protein [Chloroflexota bacterium]